MTNDDQVSAELDHQMQQLLAKIEKEPISPELRALADKLQKLLDAKKAVETDEA